MPANISREQREFIVRKLAAFYSPREIAILFAVRFPGVQCSENDVRASDPREVILPPELCDLFEAERKAALENPLLATYADKRARLILLSRQVDTFNSVNSHGEVRSALRQIAEEMGTPDASPPEEENDAPIASITYEIVDPAEPKTDAAGPQCEAPATAGVPPTH